MERGLINGLSHEPLIDETAHWIVDPMFEVDYAPDASSLAHYIDVTYGMTEEQAMAALAIAEERYQRALDSDK